MKVSFDSGCLGLSRSATPLADLVAQLAELHGVDVVILAGCGAGPGLVLSALNSKPGAGFHFPRSLCEKIMIFTRFSGDFLRPLFESASVSIRRPALPARAHVLLATAHLPSKLYWSEESQSLECTDLATRIRRVEKAVGHSRTVLVGDLNMNPFEKGLVAAGGLNAVMTRRIAAREPRTVQGRHYPYFYNPMWSHFGDMSGGAPRTHYYDRSEHVTYYWNIFDQVLLRPELAERLEANHIRIITSVGSQSLVREDGRPDSTNVSDHLPLLFQLRF